MKYLKDKIENKKCLTGIIGLGYVGLPLMHAVCSQNMKVLGFDIDPAKTEKLNAGETYLDTVPASIISAHVNRGLFEATHDFARLKEADVILICVPTPLNDHREPDLSYVEETAEAIAKTLRADQLIILESTTYPGTLEEIVKPVLESGSLRSGKDFYLAYSPEREDPGNPHFETSTIPKVVGGQGAQALDLACLFYNQFLKKVIAVSSAQTAEAVKITENIFRAVNIALVNELKLIYEKMGIDVWEVIEAAQTKPFGYMPFYPGPGLGGHCIPIDPFYLTWKARQHDIYTKFIELAGEINTAMPKYVFEKTTAALSAHAGKALKGSRILMVGIAYKKNINDQRESPAFPIMKLLEDQGARVDYFDPHIPAIAPLRRYPQFSGRKSVEWNENALKNYDAVLIITDHETINYAAIAKNANLVIDTRNTMKAYQNAKTKIVKA